MCGEQLHLSACHAQLAPWLEAVCAPTDNPSFHGLWAGAASRAPAHAMKEASQLYIPQCPPSTESLFKYTQCDNLRAC